MTQRTHSSVFRGCLLAALFAIATASSAAAGPVAFYDEFTPSDVFFKSSGGGACVGNNANDTVTGQRNGGCDSLAFSLDLPGYDPLTDTLYTALVSLAFHDDKDWGTETLTIELDALTKNVTVTQGSTNGSPFFYNFWNPLDQITEDGRVDLVLTQTGGDFWFDGAGIAALGTRATDIAAVPEPGSMMLLGTGLVGLVARYRRRRR